jgi:hypothetical protein
MGAGKMRSSKFNQGPARWSFLNSLYDAIDHGGEPLCARPKKRRGEVIAHGTRMPPIADPTSIKARKLDPQDQWAGIVADRLTGRYYGLLPRRLSSV